VIIAGIMVSFLLNEWRQERKERSAELRLMADLRDDLRKDSLSIASEIKDMDMVLQSCARLNEHAARPLPADSVLRVLGPPLSYMGFWSQNVSYQAMKSTGSANLLQDKELLHDLTELHELRYAMLAEASDIDKRMVLEHMLPLVNQRIILRNASPADVTLLMQDTQWRNLVDFSMYHKVRTKDLMLKEQERVSGLIARLNAHLAQ